MIKKITGITMIFVGIIILGIIHLSTLGVGLVLGSLILVVEGLGLIFRKQNGKSSNRTM